MGRHFLQIMNNERGESDSAPPGRSAAGNKSAFLDLVSEKHLTMQEYSMDEHCSLRHRQLPLITSPLI